MIPTHGSGPPRHPAGLPWRSIGGWLAAAGAVGLLWLQVYLCREAFTLEFSGYANAMHGFWMALAEVPFLDWLRPAWWRYWDGGMPLHHTYSPLIPWLMRALSLAAGIPVSQAWHTTAAAVFVLGPLTLFLAAWRVSGSAAYSLAAAFFYSLAAPSELLAPDRSFAWAHAGEARRFYLAFVWDETPHLAALALVPLALLQWWRLIETGRGRAWAGAVAFTALAVLANPFAGTFFALAFVCLLASGAANPVRAAVPRIAAVALASYLLISPWLPPSLIETIRRNSNTYDAGAWTPASWLALALTAAAGACAAWLLRKSSADWFTRFWLLLTVILAAVIALDHHLGWHFLPQPRRYKLEFELALAPALAFTARLFSRRLPKAVPIAAAALLLPVAVDRAAAHRCFAKTVLIERPASPMIERRVAFRIEPRTPRVFVPGSIAAWLNAFTPLEQLGGGSFPTALNPSQQLAIEAVYGRGAGEDPVPGALAWLKAFGVPLLVVSGRDSSEFWRPFPHPEAFAGRVPVAWREDGIVAYRVPVRNPSLAHVVPGASLVRTRPRSPADLAEIERYAAALGDVSLPGAVFAWTGTNSARVRARTEAGQSISVQVNHHPGWRAFRDGRELPVRPDGLGLIRLDVPAAGTHEIVLRFTGGPEAAAVRAAAVLVLAAGCLLLTRAARAG